MVDFLVRFADGERECFLEWSTVSDGPNTTPCTEAMIKAYIQKWRGLDGLRDFDKRIARCRHRGHSLHSTCSLENELGCNRAGKNETRMLISQMVQFYLHDGGEGEPPAGDWPPVTGYDYAAEEGERLEGQIEPGERVWTCHRHGVHPGPYCPTCSAEASVRCEGDR